MDGEVNLVAKPQGAFWSIHNPISKWSSVVFIACDFTQKVVENGNPGACFPKVPKTFRARNHDTLILQSWSFHIVKGVKIKITATFRTLEARFRF